MPGILSTINAPVRPAPLQSEYGYCRGCGHARHTYSAKNGHCPHCGAIIKISKNGGEYCSQFCLFTGDAKRKREQEESHEILKDLELTDSLPF